ncbi:MAG: hypothetical protein IPO07_21555 [Haliscomenobacter sp.]|nr:SdrD B-like domain-containing protein [Haliscomenobacter sp.]MBK9491086.1 hypothetical protein [Haliscomenobacter sp.]
MKKSTKLVEWAARQMVEVLHFLLRTFSPWNPGHVPQSRTMNTAVRGVTNDQWFHPLWLGEAPRSSSRHLTEQRRQYGSSEKNEHDFAVNPALLHRFTTLKSRLTLLGGAFVVLFSLFAGGLQAQSGTAFRDFNGDGLQTGAEPGVMGITVKLYANAAPLAGDVLIGTTTTAADGSFNFAVSVQSGRAANAGEKLRVEFEIPDPVTGRCDLVNNVDFSSVQAETYGSAVQFITGQQANINFAVNYPGQWVENPNPDVILPCYVLGDPLAPGSAIANLPALITYKFNTNGVPASHSGGTPGVPDPTMLASYKELGATYGVAYSRQAKKSFVSAVMRRHSGFGPLGPGGIYLVDQNPLTNDAKGFFSLDDLGYLKTQYRWNGPYPARQQTIPAR